MKCAHFSRSGSYLNFADQSPQSGEEDIQNLVQFGPVDPYEADLEKWAHFFHRRDLNVPC